MRVTRLFTISLLALALATPAATALQGGKGKGKDKDKPKHSETRDWEDDDRGGNMRFQGMDRNGDGRISRSEWRGNDVSFANHDRNGDGILSGDEVRPGGRDGRADDEGRWNDRFDRLDRNDDGYLSEAEWPGDLRAFNRADLDNDGLLSLREIAQWRRDRSGRR
jgi:hypothetical protein